MAISPEARRAIAKRAIDRAAARGVPIDVDPAVVALLEEWIRGEIEMKTMRDCYLDILALREAERRGRFSQEQVRSEPDAS
jgi:type III secretion system FlhB-like substrate exporter